MSVLNRDLVSGLLGGVCGSLVPIGLCHLVNALGESLSARFVRIKLYSLPGSFGVAVSVVGGVLGALVVRGKVLVVRCSLVRGRRGVLYPMAAVALSEVPMFLVVECVFGKLDGVPRWVVWCCLLMWVGVLAGVGGCVGVLQGRRLVWEFFGVFVCLVMGSGVWGKGAVARGLACVFGFGVSACGAGLRVAVGARGLA